MKLKIRKLSPEASLPAYAHADDSGMDLRAITREVIPPHGHGLVKTGLAIELPPGTEAQIRPRSGLAARHAISLLNTPGTIDEGYRGEICILLVNFGDVPFVVEPGMRIAQMVICPVIRVAVEWADALGESVRDVNGFGSTGV